MACIDNQTSKLKSQYFFSKHIFMERYMTKIMRQSQIPSLQYFKKNLTSSDTFLWIEFNCLNDLVPPLTDWLHLTTQSLKFNPFNHFTSAKMFLQTLMGQKAEPATEQRGGFEYETLRVVVQHLKHKPTAPYLLLVSFFFLPDGFKYINAKKKNQRL